MTDNNELLPNDEWQTKTRGNNDDEYSIYVECASSLGWKIKTYDEWLKS